tara:strand:+ start:5491 stop:6168 length:678 start_codon:yes stop_codon:yes gene_type:complete
MRKVSVSPNYVKRIIAEERALMLEHNRYKHMIILEGMRMQKNGYSPEEINEGLMDIVKSLGGGFIETFKYDITLSILGALGMDKKGFLARAIANVIENADIMDFKRYFSPGGCHELSKLIMDSVAETGVEPVVDGLMGGLGINPESRIYASIREAVAKSLLDGDLAEHIETTIADWVCSFDVSKVVDVFKKSTEAGGNILSRGWDALKGAWDTGQDAVADVRSKL